MDTCCRLERLGCNGPMKPTLAELAGILSDPNKSALSALYLSNQAAFWDLENLYEAETIISVYENSISMYKYSIGMYKASNRMYEDLTAAVKQGRDMTIPSATAGTCNRLFRFSVCVAWL